MLPRFASYALMLSVPATFQSVVSGHMVAIILLSAGSAIVLFALVIFALQKKGHSAPFHSTLGGFCAGMNAMIILLYFYPIESLKGFL